MKSLFLTLSLLAPMLAHAETPTEQVQKVEAVRKTCLDNAQSNMDMKICEFSAYQEADKILNAQYKAAVDTLSKATDADSKETLRRLVASERAWIAYRDTDCDFNGVEMLGGSGESLVIGGCLADAEAARVLELDQVLNPSN